MRFHQWRVAGIAAGVALFALISSPVSAATINDGEGVDFDAACLARNPFAPPPTPNNVPSPGVSSACLIGTYDGSTEVTDFNTVSLSTAFVTHGASNVQLTATFNVDGAIPPAGSGCNPHVGGCVDLPDRTFLGVGYKALFQNPARQNNTPTGSVGGGCPLIPTGQVFDQHGHWLDGYHFFIGFDASWNGTHWIHSAQIGEYDPSPDGAFFFTELGVNNGSGGGWDDANLPTFGTNYNVTYGGPNQVTVTVDGLLESSDLLCTTGVFNTVYAKAGDSIVNVKGLSTANVTVVLPITIPTSLIPGFGDITSVGGFIFYSDITGGNSVNSGIVGTTLEALGLGIRESVSYTEGVLNSSHVATTYVGVPFAHPDHGLSNRGVLSGIPDTLGDSPACPTPTFGGLVLTNPSLNTSVGCQYDDDNIPVPGSTLGGPWSAIHPGERGTFLPEWWDTNYSA